MNRYQRVLVIAGAALILVGSPACKSKKSDEPSNAKATETQAPKTIPTPEEAASTGAEIARPTLPTDENAPLPLDPKITRGTLDNGLAYYIRPNGVPEKRAEFWLSIDTGSFQEDDDQQGLAHFLEHMAFNGTKSFPKNELIAKLESLGVEFGPHLNAYTAFDETVYKLRLPTDKPETVALGMQILSEWASGITLDPEEYDRERGVVLAEKRSRDGAQMRLMQSVISDVFAGTRYANRLPIGIPEVLEKAPVSSIKRYYEDWYHPANMAVYVVGDIDANEIEGMIKERFGAMEARANPRPAPERNQPKSEGLKFLTLQDEELPLTAVAIGRLEPKAPERSIADNRKQMVKMLALVMLSKRMEEKMKRGEAKYLMAGGAPVPLLRETSATAFFAMVNPEDVPGGFDDLLHEMERARRHGFTASELERANTEILSMVESAAKEDAANKEQSAELVDELTRYHLMGTAMAGRPMELAMLEHFAKTISVEEVSKSLEGLLDPEGMIVMSIGSAAKDALSETKVRTMLSDVANASIAAYADEPSNTEILPSKPTPGTIVSEKHYDASDVHEWTLSNGATVVLKESDYKSDEILFLAVSPGGMNVVDEPSKLAPIREAASVVAQGGIGSMDSIALQRALAGRVVSMAPFIGQRSEGLRGKSSVSDLETMLKLAHLYFVAPRKDEKAFAVYKQNTITSLEQVEKSPETRFAEEFMPWTTNKDPRRPYWNKTEAAKLDLDASMTFYEDRMKNAGDFHFFVVGNFKRDEIKDEILTYIGGLPDEGRREQVKVHSWPGYGARKVVKKRDGSQKRATIRMYFNKDHTSGMPSAKKQIAWKVFADAVTMHYLALFREELGDTYSVGMRSGFENHWTHAVASIAMQVAPDRATATLKRAESELAKLTKEGVSSEYFQKAKEAVVKGHEVDMKRNGFWIANLDELYFHGKSPEELMSLSATIDALSEEDVKAAAESYLDTTKPVIGVHLPK